MVRCALVERLLWVCCVSLVCKCFGAANTKVTLLPAPDPFPVAQMQGEERHNVKFFRCMFFDHHPLYIVFVMG